MGFSVALYCLATHGDDEHERPSFHMRGRRNVLDSILLHGKAHGRTQSALLSLQRYALHSIAFRTAIGIAWKIPNHFISSSRPMGRIVKN